MSYRIASFNIQKFSRLSVMSGESGSTRKDLDAIGRIIRENDFDIIAIQEIFHQNALKELLEKISLQYSAECTGDDLHRGNKETGSFNINNLMNDSYGYRTKHWEGRWAAPNSSFGGNIAEGYAFIWNRDRIALVSNHMGESFEPRIADFGNAAQALVRPPLIGRFMPINGMYEFRLINTHIVYSAPVKNIDETEDAGSEISATDTSDATLRINEFKSLVGSIYNEYSKMVYDKTGHDTNARLLVPYTFLMGDYNLNLDSAKGAQSSAKLNESLAGIELDGMKVVTVNDELTTLKGKCQDPDKQRELRYNPNPQAHLANNYDHFSYDINTLIRHDIGDPTSGVIAAYDEFSGEETDIDSKFDVYRIKVSDHIPIYIDFDIRKRRRPRDIYENGGCNEQG